MTISSNAPGSEASGDLTDALMQTENEFLRVMSSVPVTKESLDMAVELIKQLEEHPNIDEYMQLVRDSAREYDIRYCFKDKFKNPISEGVPKNENALQWIYIE
ncbi:MAG: hypothetical protein GY861_28965 [bacterium]|nr:hypothetical protein [bacterium]